MRYHLFLNSFRKVLKIAKVFSRKLAVPRYMSTSVYQHLFHMNKVFDALKGLQLHAFFVNF